MNTVLVYCNKGKSRSPTIVIGYLMKFHDLKCEYAIERVKKLHPTTSPIKAFIKYLYAVDAGSSRDKCNSCYCLVF
jgi:protein-tyrosine phosphatase